MSAGIKANADGSAAVQVGGSDYIAISSTGNVGIGTTSPGAKADIVSSGLPLRVASSTTSGYALAQFGQSATATQNWHFGSEGDGFLNFYNGNFGAGTKRLALSSSGDLQFNSGYGSVATAYGCRAWVNFNGTGVVSIRASGNVTSITDNGVGDYTVNFTSAMPDANYTLVSGAVLPAAGSDRRVVATNLNTAPTASAVRISTGFSATADDVSYAQVSIFR